MKRIPPGFGRCSRIFPGRCFQMRNHKLHPFLTVLVGLSLFVITLGQQAKPAKTEDSVEEIVGVAERLVQEGKIEKAIEELRRALRVYEKKERPIDEMYLRTLEELGDAYLIRFQVEESLDAFSRCVKTWRTMKTPPEVGVRLLRKLAFAKWYGEGVPKALPFFEEALKLAESSDLVHGREGADLLFQIAANHQLRQKKKEAAEFWNRGLECLAKTSEGLEEPILLPISAIQGLIKSKGGYSYYPGLASAIVDLSVDEKGKSVQVRVVVGDPQDPNTASFIRNLHAATFEPLVVNGKPLKMRGLIYFRRNPQL
jgi:tetratricopeptide (TPR) repeat protein